MTAARDVVTYIQQRYPDAGEMELCKLAYYAQAWHVTWEGAPLFNDRIEAWRHGPVPAECWREHKRHMNAVVRGLSAVQRAVVDAVLDFYGGMSAAKLRGLTHAETPWRSARGNLPENANSEAEITVESMRRFYTTQSMETSNVPKRPSITKTASDVRTAQIARRQAERWSGTLSWLASR